MVQEAIPQNQIISHLQVGEDCILFSYTFEGLLEILFGCPQVFYHLIEDGVPFLCLFPVH